MPPNGRETLLHAAWVSWQALPMSHAVQSIPALQGKGEFTMEYEAHMPVTGGCCCG